MTHIDLGHNADDGKICLSRAVLKMAAAAIRLAKSNMIFRRTVPVDVYPIKPVSASAASYQQLQKKFENDYDLNPSS